MPLNAVPDSDTLHDVESSVGVEGTRIRSIQREDKEAVRALLVETGVFRPEEIDVAVELIDVVLNDPAQHYYEIYACVDTSQSVLGYICFGPTPMTKGTFDLYWIAVRPSAQHHGVGKRLLAFSEEAVRAREGRLIVAETSSQPSYLKARTFYSRNGFTDVAHIKDYYSTGDDLIIYAKYLRPPILS